MALVLVLNTNEVKDAAGVEVEFTHRNAEGRKHLYQKIGESPSAPHRLGINHSETGAGLKARRRSVVRFDKTFTSQVDAVTPVVASAYVVVDLPVGHMTTSAEAANVLANAMSFVCTTGAGTTVLFDGTGTGAKCLLNGES